jgi:hypothetical protein
VALTGIARKAGTRIRVAPRERADRDALQLSRTVMPTSGASMRILESTIAVVALAAAILIGFAR